MVNKVGEKITHAVQFKIYKKLERFLTTNQVNCYKQGTSIAIKTK